MALSLFSDPFFRWADHAPALRDARNRVSMPTLGAVDVVETDKAHIYRADAPGLTADEVKVDVSSDGVLTISGERVRETVEDDEEHHIHHSERSFGSFKRAFRLPDDSDLDNVGADVKEGVLSVTVPKLAEPAPKTRSIKVGHSSQKRE
eukprot:m.15481 g.15481  ORF g.15481 m.15481 type:complete len:149 (-) comp5023_c2_seq1:241-687(-)